MMAQLIWPEPVLAHGGTAVTPDNWATAWNWDLLILVNCGLMGAMYGRGIAAMWGKAGVGRTVGRVHAAAFYTSLAVVLAALISPLDSLSGVLASAHMTQHMLLMVVAAPLFVLGSPALVFAWGLPPEWRRPVGRWWQRVNAPWLWSPMLVWLLYAAILWAWHFPLLYHAALRHPIIHDVQHLSFFAVACVYWRVLVDPVSRRCLHPGLAVLFLFATGLHASLLGVFMTVAPRPWYEDYAGGTIAWGLTLLEDQQLAGLIMWAPGCLVYPAAAATLFGRWLAHMPSDPLGTPARC